MFNNHLPLDFLVDAFFPYVGWYSSSSSSSSEELSAASFNPLRPLTSQIHSHCCFSDSSPWAARGNPHPHPPPRCQLRVRHHVPGRRPPPGHSIVGSCHRMALAPCGVHRRRRTHVVIIIYQFEWPLWGQVNASHHCDNSQSQMLSWIPVQSFQSTDSSQNQSLWPTGAMNKGIAPLQLLGSASVATLMLGFSILNWGEGFVGGAVLLHLLC